MKVAIHQPNFYPWLGYFDKFQKADIWIFLNDVQNPRQGSGNWVHRVKMWDGNKSFWWTLPLDRRKSGNLVNELEALNSYEFWRKTEKKFIQAYSKAPFFDRVMNDLASDFSNSTLKLSEWNEVIIRRLAKSFDLKIPKIYRSQDLKVASQGSQRLIDLVKAVHGQTYLCGGGSSGYLEPEPFKEQGIQIEYQNFEPSKRLYARGSEGLSVIDALFEIGPQGVGQSIKSCKDC